MSIKYLKKFNKEKINLAEAGVADGLTSWFTINCLNKENIEYQDFFLIDSWEPMKKEFLEEKEIKQVNRYKENSKRHNKIDTRISIKRYR